jgi:2-polyprenyl-3-methyl-5-hydroxy-6-metoxy-1,4-benzoquinol methylase
MSVSVRAVTDDSQASEVLGDVEVQSEALEQLSEAVQYRRWLTSLALPYLGDRPLELGSGTGDYAAEWLASGVPSLTASDLEPGRVEALRQRFAQDPRVTVRQVDAAKVDGGPYTSVVAFNVLEHVPDHVAALRAAAKAVVPGGHVVMFVPAFEFAMSDFDRSVGHVRRYTKDTLRSAFVAAGLTPTVLRYVNLPGLPAWFVGMRLLGMTPSNGPILKVWDNAVVPLARAVERRVAPPFGQSVLAVARVEHTAEPPVS